jgi:translocation and assembly module TamB
VFRKILLTAAVACAFFAIALTWYVHTDSFQQMVRRRLIAALEHITGGKAEVGKVTAVPFRFRVAVRDLTIHGKEAPGDIPYAHVDHLTVHLKIISVFETEFGFQSLLLDHPVVHLIVYADGSTNQPAPTVSRASEKTPIEQLFAMSIGYLQVSRGELLWNDQRIPVDFGARDISAQLNYSLLRRRYESYVRIGKFDTKLAGFQPFSSIASAQFSLGEQYVEFQSLEWASGRSHLEASGRVEDFRNPKFSGTYNAKLDLAEAGSITRTRALRSGELNIGGKGTYSAADFLTNGKLLLKDLEWRDESLTLHRATLSAQYNANPRQLKLSDLQARVFDGTAVGDAEVVNWLARSHPGTSNKKEKQAEEQRGTVRLRYKDLSVRTIAESLSTNDHPLVRLRLSGHAGGTVEAKWRGRPQNAEAAFAVNVSPPAGKLLGAEIPLNGSAIGTYRAATDELELSDLNLATLASQIRASGILSSTASLRVSASTSDLGEWQPILEAFRGPQIPIKLDGRASFNGTATGKLSNPMLVGRVQISDFETTLPARGGNSTQQVHWDSLVADVQYSPRMLSARNGFLTKGPARIAFDVSAQLSHGQLLETSPFTARIHVHDAQLEDLQTLLGYSYPVSGRLELSLTASGTRLDPHGDGQAELKNGVFYGQPISHFASDLHFGGGEAQLNNIQLVANDARVSGGAGYSPGTHEFHFNLSGTNFDLVRFPHLQQAGFPIEGRMDFTAKGSGTTEAPVITANVHLRDLTFDNERSGDFVFDAVTHGPDLQLTGHSNFQNAELTVDGNIRMREQWPADLSLRFDRLDVDSLLRSRLHNRLSGHSLVAGTLRLSGPLKDPRQLSATGDLNQVALTIENISLKNEGPVRFSVARQVLTLDQMRLVGEGTDISARGMVQLNGERQLDLQADGRLNLKLLESFSPDLSASGAVTVSAKVNGTAANPALSGRVEVVNGAVASSNLPNGLSDMNGTLLFNQDRLEIQSLVAHMGGGLLNLTGYMVYSPRLSFNVTAKAQDVRLRPAGISATSNAELHLVGTANDAVLSGEVTIVKLNLATGFDFARYLETSKQTTTLPQGSSILNKVRLDVHVVTTPELQLQSSLAKVSGEADLHLRGTLVRPTVLGRIDIMEGEVYFSGTKYRLERGEITFTGPVGIQATLDLQATTRVRDYDITLGVTGTPNNPLHFNYRSEPPLPEADIIALLALGRTQSESATLSGSNQSAFSQEASNVILNQALNATLSNRTQRLFGISRIRVDPQGLNTETSPTHTAPAVTIEEQVASNFTVTYSQEVSQTSQQVIQAEYNVTRNISILAVRDQNGVISFDVRLRQRRK